MELLTRHNAWARATGALCKNLQTFGIGFDVDLPEDLVTLLSAAEQERVGEQTRSLLAAGLGVRLATVMATIKGAESDSSATGDAV